MPIHSSGICRTKFCTQIRMTASQILTDEKSFFFFFPIGFIGKTSESFSCVTSFEQKMRPLDLINM